jgi:cysteinyl-tRNA synthetase
MFHTTTFLFFILFGFLSIPPLFPLPGAIAAEPLALGDVKYWAYQIQNLDDPGAVEALAASRYDMVVVDPTVTSEWSFNAKQMVQALKASKGYDGVHRKLVLAYIDIGQAEEWRWYWHGHPTYEQYGGCRQDYITQIRSWAPWVVACDPDGWGGNYPVAYWEPAWHEVVLSGTDLGSSLNLSFDSMLDEVVQDGFDGVYLDWVEAWEMDAVQQRAASAGVDPGQEMLRLIQAIKNYGRQVNQDFIVIQQNSSELLAEVGADQLGGAVDAIAQEGVWWDGDAIDDDWNDPAGYDQGNNQDLINYYLPRLRRYRDNGFPVFICEYAVVHAEEAYNKAAAEGFIGYATRRPLSRLTTTPPFPASPSPSPSPSPPPAGKGTVVPPLLLLLSEKSQ